MKKVNIAEVLSIINTNIKEMEITYEKQNDDLFQLGMDSVVFIKIIVALEENFECEIPDSKLLLTELNTVEKIMSTLQELYNESNV